MVFLDKRKKIHIAPGAGAYTEIRDFIGTHKDVDDSFEGKLSMWPSYSGLKTEWTQRTSPWVHVKYSW